MGDPPDPTIFKDGRDYYMTFSSFYSYPGIAIRADRIEGPWSEPVDLKIHGCIDSGHIVGEDVQHRSLRGAVGIP